MNNKLFTRRLVEIAMLSAIAVLFMFFEIPLPFVPSFYKIDLGDIPALIGGFAISPLAGLLIEAFKVIIFVILKGSSTMWVGELGNFIIGISLILPASIIYKFHKTKKNALIGMSVGTLIMASVGSLINAYFLLPMYARLFGMPLSNIVEIGTKINSHITNVFTFVLFAVVPFNLIKGILITLIVMLIYKKLRIIIK